MKFFSLLSRRLSFLENSFILLGVNCLEAKYMQIIISNYIYNSLLNIYSSIQGANLEIEFQFTK